MKIDIPLVQQYYSLYLNRQGQQNVLKIFLKSKYSRLYSFEKLFVWKINVEKIILTLSFKNTPQKKLCCKNIFNVHVADQNFP